MIRTSYAICALSLTALLGLGSAAQALDHTNLDEGLPITIEDAYPTRLNAIEFQSYFRYDRASKRDPDGRNRYWYVPRLDIGPVQEF